MSTENTGKIEEHKETRNELRGVAEEIEAYLAEELMTSPFTEVAPRKTSWEHPTYVESVIEAWKSGVWLGANHVPSLNVVCLKPEFRMLHLELLNWTNVHYTRDWKRVIDHIPTMYCNVLHYKWFDTVHPDGHVDSIYCPNIGVKADPVMTSSTYSTRMPCAQCGIHFQCPDGVHIDYRNVFPIPGFRQDSHPAGVCSLKCRRALCTEWLTKDGPRYKGMEVAQDVADDVGVHMERVVNDAYPSDLMYVTWKCSGPKKEVLTKY